MCENWKTKKFCFQIYVIRSDFCLKYTYISCLAVLCKSIKWIRRGEGTKFEKFCSTTNKNYLESTNKNIYASICNALNISFKKTMQTFAKVETDNTCLCLHYCSLRKAAMVNIFVDILLLMGAVECGLKIVKLRSFLFEHCDMFRITHQPRGSFLRPSLHVNLYCLISELKSSPRPYDNGKKKRLWLIGLTM